MFDGLKSLKHLSLDNNRLTSLHLGIFSTLQSLEVLGVSSNEIASIWPGCFTKLPNLSLLYLFNNNLTTVHKNIFHIPNHTNLYLLVDGNPLHCDREMCWLKEAELSGRVVLTYSTFGKPECDGKSWDYVTLDCHKVGMLLALVCY